MSTRYVKPLDIHQHKSQVADMLNALQWDYFLTLTFAEPRTEKVAYKHVKRYLEQWAPVLSYFCLEHGERLGRLHAHAIMLLEDEPISVKIAYARRRDGLIGTSGQIEEEKRRDYIADAMAHKWAKTFGICQVKPAIPGKGGDYLTKYVTKGALENYDFVSRHESGQMSLQLMERNGLYVR